MADPATVPEMAPRGTASYSKLRSTPKVEILATRPTHPPSRLKELCPDPTGPFERKKKPETPPSDKHYHGMSYELTLSILPAPHAVSPSVSSELSMLIYKSSHGTWK